MTVARLGWHFTPADCRLRYGDGRLVVAGETLTVDEMPSLCRGGLHASHLLLDALKYAPGPYIWRVSMSADVLRGTDKMVASGRTAVWGFDASDVLRDFARREALGVAHLWDAPDVVLRYLRTGDESIRGAARIAAVDAAWTDPWSAAGNAAWSAAEAAAWDAARNAARAAANQRQNRRLTAMVCAEARRRGIA